jgi:ATP-dependent Lon protease
MDWIKNIFKNSNDESEDFSIEEIHEVMPVLPLKDAILLPGAVLPLIVTNPTSASLIREFHATNSSIVAVGMRKPHEPIPAVWENLFRVGCVAKITKVSSVKPGELSIMIRGVQKVYLEEKVADNPYLKVRITTLAENMEPTKQVFALALSTREVLSQLARMSYQNLESVLTNLAKIKDPAMMLATTTTNLPIPAARKQGILEEDDFEKKFSLLYESLRDELDILELSSKITEKARGEINTAQREYYLRQQLKAIKKELGESGSDAEDEMEELRGEIAAKGLPEEVKTEIEKT